MPGPDDGLGKKAEEKIKLWLDRPDLGYSFDRFYDQMSGYYKVSRNICDFVVYKYPYQYYIESKSTWKDRFDFSMISQTQFDGLLEKSKIDGVHSLVIVLFASHKRAFIFDIRELDTLTKAGVKSVNINKVSSWAFRYVELYTVPSRKSLLDYEGSLENYVQMLKE